MSKIPNKRIHENTIRNIIRNEKYKGLLIIGKKSNDFYEKKQERMPESEWATFPGGCPAIVSEELWERANVILSKKAEDWKASVKKKGVVRDFSGRYPLSGKLICDSCGEKYYHAPMGHSGRKMIGWRCDNYARNSRKPNGCRSVRATILDDELYPTLKTAIFEHLTKNAEAIELALQLAAKALRKKAGTGGRKTTEKQIVKAEADLKAFRKKMILAAKNDDELTSYKEIETEMARELEAMKQKRMEERVHEDDTAGKINRMQLMRQELNKFADTPGTMADAALDEYVKKITVSVDGKATIYLYHVPIPAVVQLPKRVRRNAKSRPKV